MPGHFGVELDLRQLNLAESETLKGWINLYKAHRDQLHHGQVWLGEGDDSVLWQAHGQADDLLIFVYRLGPMTQKWPSNLILPMVDEDKVYRVEEVRARQSLHAAAAPVFDDYRSKGVDLHGAWLAQQGLPLPPRKAETCLIYRVRTLDQLS